MRRSLKRRGILINATPVHKSALEFVCNSCVLFLVEWKLLIYSLSSLVVFTKISILSVITLWMNHCVADGRGTGVEEEYLKVNGNAFRGRVRTSHRAIFFLHRNGFGTFSK